MNKLQAGTIIENGKAASIFEISAGGISILVRLPRKCRANMAEQYIFNKA